MSDKDFIERASIAAMHASLINPSPITTFGEITKNSVLAARTLLNEVRQHNFSDNESNVMEYIREVDETHGRYTIQLNEKIETLEYKVANLIRILEENVPGVNIKKEDEKNTL